MSWTRQVYWDNSYRIEAEKRKICGISIIFFSNIIKCDKCIKSVQVFQSENESLYFHIFGGRNKLLQLKIMKFWSSHQFWRCSFASYPVKVLVALNGFLIWNENIRTKIIWITLQETHTAGLRKYSIKHVNLMLKASNKM